MTRARDGQSDLARDLTSAVRGEVSFSDGARHLFATDGSNYRQVPLGVVCPKDAEDVMATLEICRRWRAPILARGAGTSLAGQACNEAVVLDFSRHMNRILEIDREKRVAVVEPGVILDQLREAAGADGLTFGPDPATHAWCTVGGMIANDSCGVHSLAFGRTRDNVESLSVALTDGTVLSVGETTPSQLALLTLSDGRIGDVYSRLSALGDRYSHDIRRGYPRIPRAVSGYNLGALLPENGFNVARALVGSEGTCALTVDATLRLVPKVTSTALLLLGYSDIFAAADSVPGILESACIGLEGFDSLLVDLMRRKRLNERRLHVLPPGGGWLLAEFGGESPAAAAAAARNLMVRLAQQSHPPTTALVTAPAQQRELWEVRESALAAAVHVPGWPDTWEGWEDAAVDPSRLGSYLRDLRRLLDDYGYQGPFYGHFGEGCVHNRITFDLKSDPGIAKYRRFVETAADLVVSHGGSLSGEHGDGQSRGELLSRMFSPELVQAFREFKTIWDSERLLNPGKLIDARPLDQSLKTQPPYRARSLTTVFSLTADDGSLARAADRCVGVGKCRRAGGGVMCPSFMVTGEEEHSTRGRAHLLAEMMRGEDGLRGEWRSKEVKDSMDLCLACKGCKSDCPASVDVATYKAEFLAHYYRGRLRPRSAYTMGLIHRWAKAGSRMPRLVNASTANTLLAAIAKSVAGVAQERTLPLLAPLTFSSWFRSHPRRNSAKSSCVIWPDTFTNYFTPDVGIAAVRALEWAGVRPILPPGSLCCGRPLYDFGMLDLARRKLRHVLAVLSPAIDAGIPVVMLEPSCLAVFRDELVNLFPHEPRAGKLASLAITFADAMERFAGDSPAPAPRRAALVQVHCHQHSVIGFDTEPKLLDSLGLDWRRLESGCCGMAGSFGFERGRKYEVSVAAGERILLPAIREATEDTLIIADGFSCREQIAQGTGRRAYHLAEAVAMSLPGSGLRDADAGRQRRRPGSADNKVGRAAG